MPDKPRKLLDQVRDAIREKHYSYKTEQSYGEWVNDSSYFTTSATLPT
jgi:hypothetical protein